MFFFSENESKEELNIAMKESSELATVSVDAKAEAEGSLTVALDSSVVITNLSLSNYQVDIAEDIGLVTYSIDGFLL